MKALIVLAHGAGAGMNHSFMESLTTRLAAFDLGTLRYNFPFVEQGKKRPDVPAVAIKTISAVLSQANDMKLGVPLFGAGKSFGGRMTSHYLAENSLSYVKGLIFYGFPLHAPGQPETKRADHLSKVKSPMLFLQGTRDTLADLKLINEVCAALPLATIVTFEGADHSFKQGKKDFITELATTTNSWIDSL
jgi:predicted alpha/beta-hydrolase family hydrolase